MIKYINSARMEFRGKTNGGVFYLLPEVIVKACTLIPLIYLWRVVISSGAEVELSMSQMLTYTYVSALLSELLVVKTAAVGWLSEGVLIKLFGRPLSVIGQLVAQTVGGWCPMLLLFSLPMAAAAPLLGISLRPATLWFLPSLLLSITLGFAIDILFACLSIKLRNMSWLIGRIRAAITSIFSGTVIPISLLPLGVAEIMQYQPFASLGGATLTLYVGAGDPLRMIGLQVFWNLVIWPAALLVFKKSREGIVSYGG